VYLPDHEDDLLRPILDVGEEDAHAAVEDAGDQGELGVVLLDVDGGDLGIFAADGLDGQARAHLHFARLPDIERRDGDVFGWLSVNRARGANPQAHEQYQGNARTRVHPFTSLVNVQGGWQAPTTITLVQVWGDPSPPYTTISRKSGRQKALPAAGVSNLAPQACPLCRQSGNGPPSPRASLRAESLRWALGPFRSRMAAI